MMIIATRQQLRQSAKTWLEVGTDLRLSEKEPHEEHGATLWQGTVNSESPDQIQPLLPQLVNSHFIST